MYHCVCWESQYYVSDTDDCSGVDCQNGGTCVDDVNGYACNCAPGYEGDHCETGKFSKNSWILQSKSFLKEQLW